MWMDKVFTGEPFLQGFLGGAKWISSRMGFLQTLNPSHDSEFCRAHLEHSGSFLAPKVTGSSKARGSGKYFAG